MQNKQKNTVTTVLLNDILSDYKDKFGMNILCDAHRTHIAFWLHDQILIRQFNVPDNSDTLLFTSDLVSCEGVSPYEFGEVCDVAKSALEEVDGVSKVEELRRFTDWFELKLYFFLCRKVRCLLNEGLNEFYEMGDVDVSSNRSIREMCNSIQDFLEQYTVNP